MNTFIIIIVIIDVHHVGSYQEVADDACIDREVADDACIDREVADDACIDREVADELHRQGSC